MCNAMGARESGRHGYGCGAQHTARTFTRTQIGADGFVCMILSCAQRNWLSVETIEIAKHPHFGHAVCNAWKCCQARCLMLPWNIQNVKHGVNFDQNRRQQLFDWIFFPFYLLELTIPCGTFSRINFRSNFFFFRFDSKPANQRKKQKEYSGIHIFVYRSHQPSQSQTPTHCSVCVIVFFWYEFNSEPNATRSIPIAFRFQFQSITF